MWRHLRLSRRLAAKLQPQIAATFTPPMVASGGKVAGG